MYRQTTTRRALAAILRWRAGRESWPYTTVPRAILYLSHTNLCELIHRLAPSLPSHIFQFIHPSRPPWCSLRTEVSKCEISRDPFFRYTATRRGGRGKIGTFGDQNAGSAFLRCSCSVQGVARTRAAGLSPLLTSGVDGHWREVDALLGANIIANVRTSLQ